MKMTKWRRGRLLGKGASGVVSIAKISSPPSLLAVKSSPLSHCLSLRREKLFLQKFQLCPNIIPYFGDDLTLEGGQKFYNIFLEYASGGSLADRIRIAGDSMPVDEIKDYTHSVLMGLSYIHKQGYAHCDIKPQNILLVETGENKNRGTMTAKIADLGLMRKAGMSKKIDPKAGFRGTAMYMAPESVIRDDYGCGVDIWALGCSVLQMFTGKYPWKYNPEEGIVGILFDLGYTEQLPEIPSGLSRIAKDFLKKCLLRDPKSRWTADMLLNHRFITGEVDELDDDDYDIKPYLIMSKSSINCGKRLQNLGTVSGKRKRIEGEEEEELKFDRFGKSIRRSLDVTSSYTPIEIFD